ncbi:protein EFR3 homolog A [Piliocolobus tephrosceles]|uniref:protein EFR3 homolog A n=1 Tax=Piliocolobus tephrosceles TaxID=591936 RepID=UPI000E6B222D|nr:protein EFR3 homolog A [Piliocolobus tephrosceles]
MPTRVCCCCSALRPRYKRLVDNIFPEDPKDGLVKADMEKLTFYAVSAPEKLDRIGSYLAERLSRDVVRHRSGYVLIAMEALDQLLMACHSQSIKPFVESFLHMVAKLLESGEPKLQVLGTNSFVKFANIEEDTPSYHRRYDFFVSRFSAMCHSCHSDPEIRTEIRIAGIRGIQGVVRKTVNDELRATIWEPQHMDKIVPSLLFNMQKIEEVDSRIGPPSSPSATDKEENPAVLAENCFRELLGRATFGNMNNAVRPVFAHLDHHKLWDPNEFAVHCFKIIMYSIQAQYSHHVIQEILGHLDARKKDAPRVRAGIIQVLLEAVAIAAKGSIGPTVLEVFNTLLKHLRLSVEFEANDLQGGSVGSVSVNTSSKDNDEKIVQNAIIQTIVFWQLSDRVVIPVGGPWNRAAVAFALLSYQPNGQQLYRHIYLGCKEEDNVQKNYELLYTSLALITIELANEEVVIDLIRLAIALQDSAIINEDNLPMFHRCGIMALVAAYLNFVSQMIAVPAFCQHVSKVIEIRTMEAPYFLPEHIFRDKCMLPKSLEKHEKDLYFLTNKIAESLGGSGYSVERLSVPYVPQVTALFPSSKKPLKPRHKHKDEDRLSRRKSIVDTVSIQVDILSNNVPSDDVVSNTEEITFEALKKAIDTSGMEEQEKEKRRLVIEKFQKAPFEEIAAQCESKANLLHDRLAQILELTIRPPPSPSGTLTITSGHAQYQSVPVYEMKFPDLCVY